MERNMQDLSKPVLDEVFGDGQSEFDLFAGTVRVADRERRIYITGESLWGIYKALNNETGDAWKIILKGCGADWGNRAFERLDRDLAARVQKRSGDVTVDDFCGFVEEYFAYFGWGRLAIDLSHTRSAGIVRCTLHNSLMADALKDVSGTVDFLVAGMLQAIFSRIAGRPLDCLQITCKRTSDGNVCEFLVSAPERISAIEGLAGQSSVNDAINELIAA